MFETNRCHFATRLFSNGSQKMSKCGKNVSDTLGSALCATFLFLPYFDIICDLLLIRWTAKWNLFVKIKVCQKASVPWLNFGIWNIALLRDHILWPQLKVLGGTTQGLQMFNMYSLVWPLTTIFATLSLPFPSLKSSLKVDLD